MHEISHNRFVFRELIITALYFICNLVTKRNYATFYLPVTGPRT